MAIETNYAKTQLDSSRRLNVLQIVASAAIDTSGKGGIKKLLSVSGKAKVTSLEALEGEARAGGRITYKIVFLTREDAVKSFDYVSDFTETLKDSLLKPGMLLSGTAEVLDIDSAVAGDEIKLQTVVDITASANISEEITYLEGIQGALTKMHGTTLQKLAGTANDVFQVEEEIETGTDVTGVLYFDADVYLASVKACDNHFIATGEMCGIVVYTADDMTVTKNFSNSFSERIDAAGVSPEVAINASAAVKDCRIILQGVEGSNVIRFEADIALKAVFTNCREENFITDICTPGFKSDVKTEEFSFQKYNGMRYFKEKVAGAASLSNEVEGVKKILMTNIARSNVANLTAEDGGFTVEGLIVANVVYLDEKDAAGSVAVELPYSLKFDCEGIKAGSMLTAKVTAGATTAKVKRDSEIEVSSDLNIDVRIFTEVKGTYITDVILGEETGLSNKAISVYICEAGQTLWDIAKALSMPTDAILAQNPTLPDVLTGGEKIIIYREITGSLS